MPDLYTDIWLAESKVCKTEKEYEPARLFAYAAQHFAVCISVIDHTSEGKTVETPLIHCWNENEWKLFRKCI